MAGELDEFAELQTGHGHATEFGIGSDAVHRERHVWDIVRFTGEIEERDRRRIVVVEREHTENRVGRGFSRHLSEMNDG